MRVTGTLIGDVVIGLLLALCGALIALPSLLLDPAAGVAWSITIAGILGAYLIARTRTDLPRRRAPQLRLNPLRGPVALLLAAIPLLTGFGMAGAALLQLLVGPVRSPVPPTSPNYVEALLDRPGGWYSLAAYAVLCAPLVEEMAFRGWIQGALERRLPPWAAIMAASAGFAALHFWYGSAVLLTIPLMLGVVCGGAVHLFNSIWAGIVLHAGWNAAMMGAAGFETRGIAISSASLPAVAVVCAASGAGLLWLGWRVSRERPVASLVAAGPDVGV